MLSSSDILFRIYSGFLGKAIGVRLGAPVEPTIWSYERIRDTYGEITQYVRDFKNFAADDDTNGPVYFIRAMRDYQLQPDPQEVAKTWLNYAAEGHGMYWWGGYGRSTEHTAYLNLRAGIEAPRSGSIAQNGAAIAEQIGGQIFIDSWGWVNPGNPARAAEMSATAASVAHDGEGLNGARFCAAMIAAAFTAKSVDELFEVGLSVIPAESTYAAVVNAVLAQHKSDPADWRGCRDLLEREWGYDRYPGVCHIIPNAGVLALAMIYGQGDLCRTVEIATMCGWDTDCNAGNAGAIIGTFEGVGPSWDKYRKPINDMIVTSGVTGALNIVDIPTFARELATLALQLDGQDVPDGWAEAMTDRGVSFDFALPGSTHGFRTSGTNQLELRWADKETDAGQGALEILVDRFERGHSGHVFWKPFYRQTDFDDQRYRPMFSPLVAAGQTVSFDVLMEPFEGDGHLRIAPYVRATDSGEIIEAGAYQTPTTGGWTHIEFTVPEAGGDAVDEIGIDIEYFGRLKFLGKLYLANFKVSGHGTTRIYAAQATEEWEAISRFTWNRGYWKKEGDLITCLTDTDADLWTGHLYTKDATVTAQLTPLSGASHLVSVRAQGTSRFYAAGFEDGKLRILREDFGTTVLAETDYPVEIGREYELSVTIKGDEISVTVDGTPALTARDDRIAYGQAGLRLGGPGRFAVSSFEIVEQ
ncbi:ADP-ribosylglycohydrolase family protein [Pseudoroseicyclus sp. H15]